MYLAARARNAPLPRGTPRAARRPQRAGLPLPPFAPQAASPLGASFEMSQHKNLLVINCDLRETRVALIEGGVIAELFIERANHSGTVGNIVLGKVSRVLPGMQAAFIDVGLDRAAFLHVEDLIRPDDFEAYLSGDAREDADGPERGAGGRRHAAEADDDDDEPSPGALRAVKAPALDDPDDDTELLPSAHSVAPDAASDGEADDDDAADGDEAAAAADAEPAADEDDASEGDDAATTDDDDDEAPAAAATDGEPAAVSAAADTERAGDPARDDNRGGRRRRRRKKGGKKGPEARPEPRAAAGRDRRGAPPKTSRVSRSVPITEVVKEGDEVVVQISKEPIGTKGARVTSHVSLTGRYVVYMPTVDHIGISKRIGSGPERARLRKVMEALKPRTGGLIVRTVAEGLTKKGLKADIGYLIKLWSEISKRHEGAKSPAMLYSELDLVLKVARDFFTDEIQTIVIDDKEEHARLVRFVEMFLPERVKDIELYSGDEPIFDAYGIEDEIGRAMSRKVPLPSGGYLIIDQAEALTAIDVNTGRFVGKGSKDLEETALKTNLEAVEEIAYQLRFRNIGGLVILDLIDMDNHGNRDKVYRRLDQVLARDKAKTTINRISELGLIEMTRKRTRESLNRTMHEPCFYCDGTGQIQSRYTVAYEILRQIRRERDNLAGYVVLVNAHPAIVDLLQTEERAAVQEAEKRYMRRIELTPRREYHIEQFDLAGK